MALIKHKKCKNTVQAKKNHLKFKFQNKNYHGGAPSLQFDQLLIKYQRML